ncbi:MAG: twin-arginine translocase subunit TatB [Pseudohongiella sp.]|nr:twin-arginine translocase subunit TatB [Pseudohongiella sp.]
MFDIGFMELLLIGVVALLVLGPEKLPGAIRTGALWVGRAKRSFNKAKAEIEQQLNADDIRRQLHNESILADIEKAKKNANKLVEDTRKDFKESSEKARQALDSAREVTPVTSSAEEGVPTEPTAKATPADKEPSASKEPSANENSTAAAHTSASEGEPSGASHESQPAESDDPEVASADPTPKPKPVKQDFYNTPPTGRITTQGGRFVSDSD